ncbi:MAG: hypothetical protein ACOZAK_02065 [Patescibacteria group bacterium]
MKQNFVSAFYFNNSNLAERVEKFLELVVKQTDFKIEKLVQQSSWWNSEKIGAILYRGTYQQQPAILKIQGVKPTTSEVVMIEAFNNQNQSKIIRPPHLYFSLPWNQELEFEAFIMEDVSREKIISLPAKTGEIEKFFELFHEYKTNCLKTSWLDKPSVSLAKQTAKNLIHWQKIRSELHPHHPLKKETDQQLLEKGVKVLCDRLAEVDWQFMHGHFSTHDLHRADEQVILLSNLYWSWRQPFYDAVFGFHWYQYDLANSEIDLQTLLTQRKNWKDYILAIIPQNEHDLKLLNLAFLERNLAGLNLDGLLNKTDKSEALMELTRKEITQVI